MIRVGVLTISDRSARGEREDLGGPAVAEAIVAGVPGVVVASARSCPMSGRRSLPGWLTGPTICAST